MKITHKPGHNDGACLYVPEQVRAENWTPAPIFSFGAVLYEMARAFCRFRRKRAVIAKPS